MSPNCQLHVTRATVPTLSIPLHIVDCLSALQTPQNEEVARCLGLFCTLSVIFGQYNNHNNNLQFSIMQKKNEAIVLQSFIHIFGMAGIHFTKFVANSKK
jgi:hypothetical protein